MIVHGSSVAFGDRAVLVTGPSGAGKSALALGLMAVGAGLVADDRTRLTRAGGVLLADAPATLRGRIEARHVGILSAAAVGPVPLVLVVDLAGPRASRLPLPDSIDLLGVVLDRLSARYAAELIPALRQYLVGGRIA